METTIADRFAEAQPWNPSEHTPSALWVEGESGWTLLSHFDDPYEAMTPLALLSDKTAVLEMFGKMTKITDDDVPVDGVPTERVRLLFAVRGDDYQVVVCREDGETFTDEGAQGVFLDLFLMTKELLGQ